MKIDTLKALAVYGNVTFIIVAGFYVLYQLATRQDLSPEATAAIGAASIFAGFVGMAIQFITGQEIATRATKAAADTYDKGLNTPNPGAPLPVEITTPVPVTPVEPEP